MTTHAVYTAINAVTAALAVEGISKSRKNAQQGYQFRGIDQFFNAIAPQLAAHKLCILPRCLSRDVVERTSANDRALFYVTVSMEFDFVSAVDGSTHKVGPFYGEAMDSGDKATNKAMSAAYKYALMQTFSIPVEGQAIDSEVDTHEVRPNTAKQVAQDAFDALSPEAQQACREHALEIIAWIEAGQTDAALTFIASEYSDHEDRLSLWSQLPANVRAALKKAKEA